MSVTRARRSVLLRPPVTAFAPTDVAALRAWFKADALAPVADATNVGTWADSSGNGADATSLGTVPKYYGNVINGKPVVRWVAGDSRYASPASAADAAQTLIAVASVADLTAARTLIGAAAAGMASYVGTDGSVRLIVQGVTVPGNGTPGAVTAGAFAVLTAVVASGACAFYVNGTAAGTGTGTYSAMSATTTILGAQNAASVFKGDIAETLRYGAVVSSANRIALHAYLGAKYGITMGGS